MEVQEQTSGSAFDHKITNRRLVELSLRRSKRLLQHDEQLRKALPITVSEKVVREECRSSIQCLELACTKLYPDRPCLGERAFQVDKVDEHTTNVRYIDKYEHITFLDLWNRVKNLASGWSQRGANSESGIRTPIVRSGDMVGICGFGSTDWCVADLACMYHCAVSVPLQTSIMPQDLQHIINETEMCCILCSMDQLPLIADVLPDCPKIRRIIVLDVNDQDSTVRGEYETWKQDLQEIGKCPVNVCSIKEVERVGSDNIQSYVIPREVDDCDQGKNVLMALMYTSGSTGTPKGAIYTERIYHRQWQSPLLQRDKDTSAFPDIGINFMPLNHLSGRLRITGSIMTGGCMHFVFKSDMSTLSEDIRIVRPTSLFLVPRISSSIYQRFMTAVVKRAAKEKVDLRNNEQEKERIKEEVIVDMRHTMLGDRLLYAMTGTAPTSPEVIRFLHDCFRIPVFDDYGTTEIHMISRENKIDRRFITDLKLADVPELGYTANDIPNPRGELCLKSTMAIARYYKNEEATSDLFDEEGFMKIGDIVEKIGPDEYIWIDRKKNILKLQNGEFVSTSRLEGIYTKSPYISQMYAYGSSLRNFLLAVIVPHMTTVKEKLGLTQADVNESTIKSLIRDDMNHISVEEQVFSYEVPRDFVLEFDPFTKDNGLLTESNKPRRSKLKAKYGPKLESMYQTMAENEVNELQNLESMKITGRGAGILDIKERVRSAISVTLGMQNIDMEQKNHSFIQLGGDSLSAVSLVNLLEDVCNVTVPLGFVLDPSSSLKAIGDLVQAQASGTFTARHLTYEQAHGKDATVIRRTDLTIEKFLGQEAVKSLCDANTSNLGQKVRTVLLTGASGFLCRFMALQLLRDLPKENGKLICIVRAANDSLALNRLRSGLRKGSEENGELWREFHELSTDGRLEVLAGDLILPRLGLSNEVYDELCETVDCIVHGGALVNHVFTYRQLFEPNVLGTVEVIRFAGTGRIKPINFISSVSIADGIQKMGHANWVRETETSKQLWNERPINSGYAIGYGTSKWACEVLLQDLYEKLNVPVNIYRCGMILAHSQFEGQINTSDFFSRLLCGIVYTGIAPRSFYTSKRGFKHFDGIPVDVVSQSIVSVSTNPEAMHPGCRIFHAVNPYWDDDVSLDKIVDWVQTAGYKIERIADYEEWLSLFRDKLSNLGEQQRQNSPLPIIHQWKNRIDVELETKLDSSLFQKTLHEISADSRIPHLTERFIHKNLEHLHFLGLIGIPSL